MAQYVIMWVKHNISEDCPILEKTYLLVGQDVYFSNKPFMTYLIQVNKLTV